MTRRSAATIRIATPAQIPQGRVSILRAFDARFLLCPEAFPVPVRLCGVVFAFAMTCSHTRGRCIPDVQEPRKEGIQGLFSAQAKREDPHAARDSVHSR